MHLSDLGSEGDKSKASELINQLSEYSKRQMLSVSLSRPTSTLLIQSRSCLTRPVSPDKRGYPVHREAAVYLLSIPRLGLELQPAPGADGLTVTSVYSWSPNKDLIAGGTILTSVLSAQDTIVLPVKLVPEQLIKELDLLSYEGFNGFLEQQSALSNPLHSGQLTAVSAQGQLFSLRTIEPPPQVLIGSYAAHCLYAFIGLLVTW